MLAKEKITTLFRSKKTESRFEQWDAESYIQLAALSQYREVDALTTLLTANFISFSAEYTRGEVVSTFEMDVDPTNGLLGMMKSYATGILGMGENFEEKLQGKGKSPTRAQLETHNLVQLDHWSVSAPIGSVFIWNSPPGLVSEGYAGLSSHSFIFVYEKVSETKVVLHQYRTWMSLSQHAEFQEFATQSPASEKSKALSSHQIIHNIVVTTPKAHGCNSAPQFVALLEKKAYESQDSWKVKPNEMPQIDEEKYAEFRDFLLSLYILQVVPLLLSEVPEVDSIEDPAWQTFIQSKKYADLVSQLDLAFGILAYQPLVKWVEATDANPKKSSLWKILFSKKDDPTKINQLSLDEVQEGLLTMYQMQVDKLHGVSIRKEQVLQYNSLASTLLSTTARGLSLGQCGLGTFIPTRLGSSLMLQTPTGTIPAVPAMATGLGAKEKSSLLLHLKTLHYLPLVLKNGQTWYIKAEHFAQYQAFFTTTHLQLSEDGVPIGPCGWALRGDSRGSDELVLSSTEFRELQALQTQLFFDLYNNPEAGFDAFAEELLDRIESNTEKQEIVEILGILQRALKKTIDVSDLLFNEFFNSFIISSHPFLAYIATKVQLSAFVLNPERTAEAVVEIYRSDRNKVPTEPSYQATMAFA